jgi:hypothetical protein
VVTLYLAYLIHTTKLKSLSLRIFDTKFFTTNTRDVISSCAVITHLLKWLWGGRPGFDSMQGEIFSLCRFIQTDSRVHPVCYPIGADGSFPRNKADGTIKMRGPKFTFALMIIIMDLRFYSPLRNASFIYLVSFFNCLGRAKESVKLRGAL